MANEKTPVPEAYGHRNELYRPAEPCVVHFPANLKIHPGQSHPHVLLAKAMLQALSRECPDLRPAPFSDTLDPAAAEDLRFLQRCADLPETGILDKPTWNRLCMLYRAMFDRNHPPAQG